MPGALAILLALVLVDIPEFDQELSESHLLLWRLLRIKLGRSLTVWISSEGRFGVQSCCRFEPIGSLMLGLSQSLFKLYTAYHSVVDCVHVHWQFVDSPSVIR